MKVRRATTRELDAIARMDAATQGAAHWRGEDYARMLERATDWLLVAEDDSGKTVGFLAARAAADEAEILNLAVDPASRRRGAGGRLVEEAVRLAQQGAAKRLYLEVRASNEAARAFYRAKRFAEISRRSNYYSDPREDAILLVRELAESD